MQASTSISYAFLLHKAWPIILANSAVPLLGLVDTAVIGNLGTVEDLGAIALGALIFSFVYWSFGFLRMSTTGFIARAAGARDEQELRAILGRALLLAIVVGVLLVGLQLVISLAAFFLLSASAQVESIAENYFAIRIWGAPATLSNFVFMGVLIGLGKSRQLLLVQLFLNGLNIVLDIWFAGILGWGAEGIALGTVIAEWSSVILAGRIIFKTLSKRKPGKDPFWPTKLIMDSSAVMKMLSSNTDIMIRTLLLVFSFGWFTNQSAQFGDVVLASNYILLQFISFSAFFLDGFAFVVEPLVGMALGAGNRAAFDIAVWRSTVLAFVTACILALTVFVLGELAVTMLTNLTEVRLNALDLLYLPAIYVLFSFAAFQLDGIFIGAAATRRMLYASIISFMAFMLAWWVLITPYGIVGLWWSFIIYVIVRALSLLLYYPGLRNKLMSQNSS